MPVEAVVVSDSPSGSLVALALAAAGRSVTLVREAPLDAPELPVGNGLFQAPPDPPPVPLGPFAVERAVLVGDRVERLPLGVPSRVRGVAGPRAVAAWAEARGRRELADLIGGGRETRTYRDWLVQRHGVPLYDRWFRSYGARRFGPPEEVIAGVARVHHGPTPSGPWLAPLDPGWRTLAPAARIADVRAIDGGGVTLADGRIDGEVWLDVAPARALAWVGDAVGEAARLDAGALRARDGVEVFLRARGELPFELHAVDDDVAFFRAVAVGRLPGMREPELVAVHFAADDARAVDAGEWVRRAAEGLGRAGIVAETADARVRVLPGHHPVWGPRHFPRFRSWLLGLDTIGVQPCGRHGLQAPTDPGQELAWVADRLAPDAPGVREAFRVRFEPPVVDGAARPHLRDFVQR